MVFNTCQLFKDNIFSGQVKKAFKVLTVKVVWP